MVPRAAAVLFAVLTAASLVLGGCSDGDGGGGEVVGTPAGVLPGSGPPPPAVPASAVQVADPFDAGAPAATPEVPEEDQHIFFTMSCADGVLSVVTTRETLFAELLCDRAAPAEVVERFLGRPVRLRVEPSVPAKLYIDSDTAGSLEFTVGRVWIEER